MEVSAKSGHNINNLFKTIAVSLPGNNETNALAAPPNLATPQQPGF
jgi:hypothetical protein